MTFVSVYTQWKPSLDFCTKPRNDNVEIIQLDDLDEEEIEARYQLNVTPYLMVQKDLLLTKYGWTEGPKADVCGLLRSFYMKPHEVTASG